MSGRAADVKGAEAVPMRADERCVVQTIERDAPLPAHGSARVLGAKAWNLARMAALGLPVPPAFVIGTGWCAQSNGIRSHHWLPALETLERSCRLRLGDPRHPLLVSVRSGAPVSMPGMMETLLNVGLTEETLPGFVRITGHPRLAWDAYRRLIAGYGETVAEIDAAHFEEDLEVLRGALDERELDFATLRELSRRHLATYQREAGEAFPQNAHEQLRQAIAAVMASWQREKAVTYRRLHGIDDDLGTAVIVQRMVFGNAGGVSGAGVGFTRDPSSGERRPWVDFLFNAQGEDVVSGRRSALDLMDEGVIDAGTAARRTHGLDAAALTQRHVVASDGSSSDPVARTLTLAGRLLHEGALITLDGNEGTIYLGATKIVESVPQEILTRLEGLRCGQSMASGG